MSAEQDLLMREVDDAVRQDQAASFARNYGKWLIGLLIVGLAAFGAYLWWQDRSEKELDARSEDLIGALDELDAGNSDQADEELAALEASGGAANAAAATMLRAGIAAEKGDLEGAAKMFASVADNDDLPDAMRNVARIRAVATNYDALEPQEVIDQLKPLATPGNPWFGSAAELVAMAYLEQGKEDLAGPLFVSIATDEKAPESLRARSRQMAGILGFDAVENVDETLDQLREQGQVSPEAGPAQ